MDYLMAILIGLIGLAFGSFLNVCIDRLPAGGSLLRPPSHCPACQRRLAPEDLIPLFSYLWLRGRCRYCGAPIPQRVLWVELTTALMFIFLWWQYGFTVKFVIMSFYYCLLTAILVIDLEHTLILNKLVYPATAIALIISAIAPIAPGYDIVKALIGGGVGLGVMFSIALIFRHGMGWGDVKMAGLMGVMVAFPGIVVALLLAVIGGGLAAVILLAFKLKGRKDAMPFGPFLSLATMVTLLWGDNLLRWYLGLFGLS